MYEVTHDFTREGAAAPDANVARQDFSLQNASVVWNEAESPFHTVARLTFLSKSQLEQDASEATYFDVTGNSTADSIPLRASIALASMGRLLAEKHGCTQATDENTQKRTKMDHENY